MNKHEAELYLHFERALQKLGVYTPPRRRGKLSVYDGGKLPHSHHKQSAEEYWQKWLSGYVQAAVSGDVKARDALEAMVEVGIISRTENEDGGISFALALDPETLTPVRVV